MVTTKPLYHYTSQIGLLGILQTKKLWMTNILFLNDSSEYIHTLDLVKSELKNRKELLIGKGIPAYYEKLENLNIDGRRFHTYGVIENIIDKYLLVVGRHCYVFSLSTKKDDLNQWRGYCPKEGGFCVEFDNKELSSITKGKSEIRECIYDPVEKKGLVDSLFNNVLDIRMESMKSDEDVSKVSMKFVIEVMNMSSYVKDESFIDEEEYRLICIGGYETKYREGKSMVIPYIQFAPGDNDAKLPISKIIVGPTPHKELSILSVKHLLKSLEYDIEVEPSKLPYRSL
jgi:hypothetical protein